jgi:hypothetical protein
VRAAPCLTNNCRLKLQPCSKEGRAELVIFISDDAGRTCDCLRLTVDYFRSDDMGQEMLDG